MWPLAICWIIHACHIGCAGIINDILSFKYFIPISNLSLGIYLLNDHVGHYIVCDVLSSVEDFGFPMKAVSWGISYL